MLWYNQGDAAAKVGAEVVDGGGAPKLDDTGKTKQKGTKGKKKWPFGPIYKARDMCQARKSRDRGFGNEAVASIVADLLNKKGIMDKFLYNRWRHAGLQRPEKMTSRRFNKLQEDVEDEDFC